MLFIRKGLIILATQTEQEVLARSLYNASGKKIKLEQARDIIHDNLQPFCDALNARIQGKQPLTPDTIGFDRGNVAGTFLRFVGQQANIHVPSDYVSKNFFDQKSYSKMLRDSKKQVSQEYRASHTKMGPMLNKVLSQYVSNYSMRNLKQGYHPRPGSVQYDPSEAYPNDEKKMQAYNKYKVSVNRAYQMLKYLNANQINASITNDQQKVSEIVARLPEYGNMQVTIMADDPRKIGQVNTWDNQYGFDKMRTDKNGKQVGYDPLKYNPAIILDTVLNNDAKLQNVSVFPRQKGSHIQHTRFERADLPGVAIFTTSDDKRLKSAARFKEETEAKKNELSDQAIDDFAEELGLNSDEDESRFKISPQDRAEDIAKRMDNQWVAIDSPEKVEAEHKAGGLYKAIQLQAKALGMQNVTVSKNKHGVYRYDYSLKNPVTGRITHSYGILGGYIKPEKDGSYKLQYNGKFKGYAVPGMRGYIDQNSGDLHVKPFGKILYQKIRETMQNEMLNPELKNSAKAYSALDSLYTTDGYSTIIQKGRNSPKYERTLVKTLRRRIRLDNEVVQQANAFNEDQNHVDNALKQLGTPLNKRQEMLMTQNIRTIPKQWVPYVDREMTGIGATMGASLYLADDAQIDPKTGRVSAGKGTTIGKSALHRLPQFQWNKYDAVDRNIMCFNQMQRNVPMDVVNVAMMTMSGYTENDAAVVSAKYAKNHQIMDKKTHKMRDLRRGDKITDGHGNKSTISAIIDPNETDPKLMKKYAQAIAVVQANPDIDVIVNPYSSISRLNTGSIHEMQDRGGMTHMNDAMYTDEHGKKHTIPLSHVTMGKEMYAVCVDQAVDEKTKVYTREDYEKGNSRKFGNQEAAAADSDDLQSTLKYLYKDNNNLGWERFFDDMHILGYDIDKQHNIGHLDYNAKDALVLKLPTEKEIKRNIELNGQDKRYELDDFKEKLDKIRKQAKETGATKVYMELPTEYVNAAGQKTNKVPIPLAQIEADEKEENEVGVTDNKKTSAWKNQIHKIYRVAAGLDLTKKAGQDAKGNWHQENVYDPDKAATMARRLGSTVISKDFGDKKNVIKNGIYSSAMANSATGVLTPDPSLDIDTIAVGPDIYDNLNLKNKDDLILYYRNPVMRGEGLVAAHVIKDDSLTGTAINPVNDKRMDADHDGDTIAVAAVNDEKAQKELQKLLPSNNLINTATESRESLLETGLELQGSLHRQGKDYAQDDLNREGVDADTVRDVIHQAYDSDAAYGIGLDLSSKESYLDGISKLIESGAKGHCEKDKNGKPVYDEKGHVKSQSMEKVEHYYDGKRTEADIRGIMTALSVKADVIGPSGKSQQKLLWALRNIDPTAALEVTYNTSNGVLQAKHDEIDAKNREQVVMNQLPNVIAGKKPNASPFDKDTQTSTTRAFKQDLQNIYNAQLNMDLSSETATQLAQDLDDGNGRIKDPEARLDKADPLDVLAYKGGGVIHNLNEAMENNRKIAAGKYTRLFMMPNDLCSDKVLDHDYTEDEKKQIEAKAEKQNMINQELEKREQEKQEQATADASDAINVDTSDLPF